MVIKLEVVSLQHQTKYLIMKKDMIAQLKAQEMELIKLISINKIASINQKDNGELNHLQRSLLLNQSLQKLLKDEN